MIGQLLHVQAMPDRLCLSPRRPVIAQKQQNQHFQRNWFFSTMKTVTLDVETKVSVYRKNFGNSQAGLLIT
jgi:hypothetical protein